MKMYEFDTFPNTTFKYYANKKVIVTSTLLGDKIVIELYKPGIYCDQNKGYAKCPVVIFRMNGEISLPKGRFVLLEDILSKAISILNIEKRGTIRTDIINCFDFGYFDNMIDYTKVDNKVIYLKQSDLKIGHIYMELNGRKSIYFGNCHLYKEQQGGHLIHTNKTTDGIHYSRFVYGSQYLIDAIQKGIKILPVKVFTHNKAKEETIYSLNVPDFRASTKFIDSFTIARKYIVDVGSIELPEEAKFIKVSNYGAPEYVKPESCVLIKRKNKTEQMKTDSFNISEDGLETMISLAEEG